MDKTTKRLVNANFIVRQISEKIYNDEIDHNNLTKMRKEVNRVLREAITLARRSMSRKERSS